MTLPDRHLRIAHPGENPDRFQAALFTAEERLRMMWPLAREAWAFKGEPVIESGFPRQIVHHMTAGMTAEVYIKTRERTALEYLLEPVTAFLQRSFRET